MDFRALPQELSCLYLPGDAAPVGSALALENSGWFWSRLLKGRLPPGALHCTREEDRGGSLSSYCLHPSLAGLLISPSSPRSLMEGMSSAADHSPVPIPQPHRQGAQLGCSELVLVTSSQSQEVALDLNFLKSKPQLPLRSCGAENIQ